MAAARELQARLTKPAGSLGALEELSVRLAGLAGVCPPPLPEPAAVAVFAGDHGVHAQGVTPVAAGGHRADGGNFLAGGAVVNAFARQAGADGHGRRRRRGHPAARPAADGLLRRPSVRARHPGPDRRGRR